MNVQYAIKDDVIFVLEVNPRASRTVPFVAKTVGSPIAKVAAKVMAGEQLADAFALTVLSRPPQLTHIAVKEAVFPFAKFPGVDTLLGPGDALDRRGHGPRPRLRAGLRQGRSSAPAFTCRARAAVFVSAPLRGTSRSDARGRRASWPCQRLQGPGDRRHRRRPAPMQGLPVDATSTRCSKAGPTLSI